MTIPAHERLLDLIIALTQSRVALTRNEIRQGVNGYTPADGTPQNNAAFERMFERDKEMLKELGIPLVTVHGTGHYDDIGYRIDVSDYRLPKVQFSPAELGAIALASHVWDGSVLARYARRGLTKLRGAASDPAESLSLPTIRPHEPDEALPIALEALAQRQVLEFSYAAASTGVQAARTVEPWQILAKNHGWYLWGWDRDRAAPREFRLSRMIGRVRALEDEFVGGAPQQYAAVEATQFAEVAIRPDAGAALRARGERGDTYRGWDLYRLPILDLVSLAGELSAFGDNVLVVAPAELRALVIDRLNGAVHAAQGSGAV